MVVRLIHALTLRAEALFRRIARWAISLIQLVPQFVFPNLRRGYTVVVARTAVRRASRDEASLQTFGRGNGFARRASGDDVLARVVGRAGALCGAGFQRGRCPRPHGILQSGEGGLEEVAGVGVAGRVEAGHDVF